MQIKTTFAAFKVKLNETQTRYDYVRGLTAEQARDLVRFPAGRQQDKYGAYTWSYGANDGEKF